MFQTKPQLAQAMLAQAWAEGVESRYVTGDALYGNSPTLRQFIADADRLYVLGIGSHHHVEVGGKRQSLSDVFADVEDKQWETIATTVSETGVIWYDCCALRVFLGADDTQEQWLLIRCTPSNELEGDEPDYDFFISNAPSETSLTDLVAVASIRHEIEQVFEEAKGQLGLADYEVRTWHGWHRHMTLCFLAHTWLMTISHTERQKKHHSHDG
jgi:SRSO17 transposase